MRWKPEFPTLEQTFYPLPLVPHLETRYNIQKWMLESCYIVFFLRDSMLHYANNSTLLSPNKTCKELPFISLPDAFCAASTWRPWEPSVQASGKTLVLLKLQLRKGGKWLFKKFRSWKTEFNNVCVFQAKPLITHSTLHGDELFIQDLQVHRSFTQPLGQVLTELERCNWVQKPQGIA